MSIFRVKIEIHAEVDTDCYPIPSDGRLTLQLKDDVESALESSIDLTINAVKVLRVAGKHEEVRDND